MQYLNSKFSVAVNAGKLTDEQWEIAMGVRCEHCKQRLDEGDHKLCGAEELGRED